MAGLDDILGAVGPIASGIGSIADLFGGSSNADDMAKMQKKLLKFEKQMGTAGQVDARGNQVVYDKATNTWRVIPTDQTKQLLGASDAEQLQQFQHDLPNQRAENDAIRTDRGGDRSIADTLARRIIDPNPMTPDMLESLLFTTGSRAAKQQYDLERGDISRQALRSSQSAESPMMVLGQKEADTMGNIAAQSKLDALLKSDAINQGRTNNNINAFQTMAASGRNTGNVPFNPSTLGTGLDAMLSGDKGQAINSGYGQSNAIAGYGNAINSNPYQYETLGTNIGSLLSGIGSLMPKNTSSAASTGLGNSAYGIGTQNSQTGLLGHA